jgi:hypothetical protein
MQKYMKQKCTRNVRYRYIRIQSERWLRSAWKGVVRMVQKWPRRELGQRETLVLCDENNISVINCMNLSNALT